MSRIDGISPNGALAITTVEKRVLARIFQQPLSHNLSWREVLELFRAVGTVEHTHNGGARLKIGDERLTFSTNHNKSLSADDVMALRHFLTRADWSPDAVQMPPPAVAASDIAIVIDHAGARVYDLPAGTEHQTSHETHHVLHSIDRKQHDGDRDETYPADHRFFDAIAKDVPGTSRIVVLSHGKGQSNQADHLLGYMKEHHRTVHDRIAHMLVADLPHMSAPQLLQLAHDALNAIPNSAVPHTN